MYALLSSFTILTHDQRDEDNTEVTHLLVRIIDQWNGLSNSTVTSKSVNAFKSALNAEYWNPYKFTCSC